MTPQELRNSILQRAIQGKLVEQRPEEGTGEELYKLIREEKITVDKSNPIVADNDILFPETWKIVRIKNIAILHNGRAYKQNELLERGKYPVLRVGNLFTNNEWYYSDLELESKKYCNEGDLLYSWSASFGPHIWRGSKVIYHYHIWKIEFSKWIDKQFLYYFLLADTDNIKRSGHGLAMIHVTKAGTEERIFPLPPLAEQKRIVAKIEELLPLVDRYEKAWNQLKELNKRFPEDMQKALLQQAIQGKLVEQRPEEGTGEELYRQIQEEKARLVKAGKIKKEKPLPEIAEDEIPFEIPETWKWVRLQDILKIQPSNGTSPKAVTYETKIKSLTLTATTSGYFKPDAFKYIDIPEEIAVRYYLEDDDILIQRSNSRELVGTACVYRNGPHKFIYPDLMMRIHLIDCICTDYIDIILKAPITRLYYQGSASGTSESMPKINQKIVQATLIPLPPISEQKRIVARLEELLPLCERLK